MALSHERKQSLISDLQSAMTKDMMPTPKEGRDSYFNEGTKTLHCSIGLDKVAISDVASALNYFSHTSKELEKSDLPEKKAIARYCRIAYSAIRSALNDGVDLSDFRIEEL